MASGEEEALRRAVVDLTDENRKLRLQLAEERANKPSLPTQELMAQHQHRLDELQKEKEAAMRAIEEEEECITNAMNQKLARLREEKVALENSLEVEQESMVLSLQREISALKRQVDELRVVVAREGGPNKDSAFWDGWMERMRVQPYDIQARELINRTSALVTQYEGQVAAAEEEVSRLRRENRQLTTDRLHIQQKYLRAQERYLSLKAQTNQATASMEAEDERLFNMSMSAPKSAPLSHALHSPERRSARLATSVDNQSAILASLGASPGGYHTHLDSSGGSHSHTPSSGMRIGSLPSLLGGVATPLSPTRTFATGPMPPSQQNSQVSEVVVKAGYMDKRNELSGKVERRWFELRDDGHLMFYDREGGNAKGVFNCRHVTSIERTSFEPTSSPPTTHAVLHTTSQPVAVQGVSVVRRHLNLDGSFSDEGGAVFGGVGDVDSGEREHALCLHTKMRTVGLAVEGEEERESWAEALAPFVCE